MRSPKAVSGKTSYQTNLEKGETLNKEGYCANSNEPLKSQVKRVGQRYQKAPGTLGIRSSATSNIHSLFVSVSPSFSDIFAFSLCVYFITFCCSLHRVGDTATQFLEGGRWGASTGLPGAPLAISPPDVVPSGVVKGLVSPRLSSVGLPSRGHCRDTSR